MPKETPSEEQLLAAARLGDQRAYERLVAPHRAALQAHCYRMLGSLHDAEDAFQEALLGAWKGLSHFEARSALRTWLLTIATNACLRLSARRKSRVLAVDHGAAADPLTELAPPLEENVWLEPYPRDTELADGLASPHARYEERESIELAFVAALQHLPATQRAVLILRDVMGLSAEETAASLDTSVASANSALQRARTGLEQRLPDASQQATRRALGDERLSQLVESFIGAWARADVDAIVAMLAHDATFTMPPLPSWFRGKGDIGTFLTRRVFALEWRFLPTHASGQPAMAAYRFVGTRGAYELDVINVFSFRGADVAGIHAFQTEGVRARFALPATLPP
jgi:RNA polymerase sigma-70 factor, ECF subfamily